MSMFFSGYSNDLPRLDDASIKNVIGPRKFLLDFFSLPLLVIEQFVLNAHPKKVLKSRTT